ncbi:MAG TPA: hypothetical protein VF787_13720 [Thermoanaerobaculia bacterium]
MTCNEFRTRLDQGNLDDAHARTCVSCNRELQAALELDRALAIVTPVTLPANFNDAVMRSIHAKPKTNALAQILAEPVVPISLAVVIMIALQFRDITAAFTAILANGASINIGVAAGITIATLIFWSSWRLFRIYEHLTTP